MSNKLELRWNANVPGHLERCLKEMDLQRGQLQRYLEHLGCSIQVVHQVIRDIEEIYPGASGSRRPNKIVNLRAARSTIAPQKGESLVVPIIRQLYFSQLRADRLASRTLWTTRDHVHHYALTRHFEICVWAKEPSQRSWTIDISQRAKVITRERSWRWPNFPPDLDRAKRCAIFYAQLFLEKLKEPSEIKARIVDPLTEDGY